MPGRDGGGFFLTCILGIVGGWSAAGWRPCLALAAPLVVLSAQLPGGGSGRYPGAGRIPPLRRE